MKSHEPPLKFHEIPIKSPIKSQENHHEITISESSASFFENPGDLAESSEALASEVTETTHEKYGDIVEAVSRGGARFGWFSRYITNGTCNYDITMVCYNDITMV